MCKAHQKEELIMDKILETYDDILLPEDLQEILHTGRNTVYTYLSKGIIKSIRIGGKYRIPKLYLIEFLYPNKPELLEKEAGD